jgi:hypothetical protein
MKEASRLALLSLLALTFTACYEDRPLIVANDDAGTPSGTAGTTSASTGTAGTTAASTGTAGTTAVATGTGGTAAGGPGCDITTLVTTKYSCTLAGACHDAQGSAANFDMASPGWEQRLVGVAPRGGTTSFEPSLCANQGWVYLVKGSFPATGLFMEKFKTNPACGIAMPNLGLPVSADDLACFQRWANALTAQ